MSKNAVRVYVVRIIHLLCANVWRARLFFDFRILLQYTRTIFRCPAVNHKINLKQMNLNFNEVNQLAEQKYIYSIF